MVELRQTMLMLALAAIGMVTSTSLAGAENPGIRVMTFEELQQEMQGRSEGITFYNFWATWCKPCIEELPAFESLSRAYSRDSVRVVLVSLDFISQLESKVIPFVREKDLVSEVLLLNAPNYNQWIDLVHPSWTGSIPASLVVLNASGDKLFFEKQLNLEELENIIHSISNR